MKVNYKITCIFIFILAIIIGVASVNSNKMTAIDRYYIMAMKARLLRDFEDFGDQLILLDEVLEESVEVGTHHNALIDFSQVTFQNFIQSKLLSSFIIDSESVHEYEKIYSNLEEKFEYIYSDGSISVEEQEYLQKVLDFNKLLASEYIQIISDLFPNKSSRSSEESDYAYDQIEHIYVEFSDKADSLLSQELIDFNNSINSEILTERIPPLPKWGYSYRFKYNS
jgi:hypothetical protein